jgi:vancomycin permeability regulator SanA
MVIFVVLLLAPTIYANLSTKNHRFNPYKTSVKNIPERKIALVFGAGVSRTTGQPTPYLQWRVETAVELYKARRVQKILMSGDNSIKKYNEPVAMKKLAVSLGVPQEDIVLDYAGYSTYDSCYRAGAIFGVRSATLITQGYHLPRAVLTCRNLGINAIGVSAKHTGRDSALNYITREWVSTDKAVIQLITKPQPTVLGKPEPINF